MCSIRTVAVLKRKSGDAFEISNISHVNGVQHFMTSLIDKMFQLREIRAQMFGWTDDLSGVSEYRLQVTQMEYNPASNKLVLSDHPVWTGSWDESEPLPTFEVQNAGELSRVCLLGI